MLDLNERLVSYGFLWENWKRYTWIGKGVSSQVYEYRQDVYGDVSYSAVKVIPTIMKGRSQSEIEEKRRLVSREIKNMNKLNNKPYLVHCRNHAFKDILDDQGKVVGFDLLIQMDLLNPLSDYLMDTGALTEDQVIKFALQIGQALKSMHEIDMLHRDIKIDNIYLNDDGDFMLGDFGISKQLTGESLRTLAGTEPFIAPEVWRVVQGKSGYSKPADIYSYGLNIYYLLNDNMLPFVEEGFTENQIEEAIDRRRNGALFPAPRNGSEALKRIVMKCCELNPEDRYKSMDDILKDLNKLGISETQSVKADSISRKRFVDIEKYKTLSADIEQPDKGTPKTDYSEEVYHDLFELEQYIKKLPLKFDNPKFMMLYNKAIAGDPNAQYNLAEYYKIKDYTKKKYRKRMDITSESIQANILYWYMKSSIGGNTAATYWVGLEYEYSWKKYEKAVYWYTKSSETGNKYAQYAQYHLGYCYYYGKGVEQDYENAVYWYTKAAGAGEAFAQKDLGDCYAFGNGVERDIEKAAYWYRRSELEGYWLAKGKAADLYYNEGKKYYCGEGVEQNYENAIYWFTKAAKLGNEDAQFSLGVFYYNGKNYKEAVYWFTKAAEIGDKDAQCFLGDCYYYGRGINQDYKKAVYWYTKSANAGNIDAQYNLGNCYHSGEGINQNDKKAVYWYTKSAESGNIDAQNKLGNRYGYGEGVKMDYKKAVYWFTKAAEAGNEYAQYNLGRCYEFGMGIEKSFEKAIYWYKKAARNGNKNAVKALEHFVRI